MAHAQYVGKDNPVDSGMADDQRIGRRHHVQILVGIVQRRQEMAHAVQARALLVV